MTKQFVFDYIDKKLEENENYIRYTFYELKVKNNLSEEVDELFRGEKIYYNGENRYILK